MTMNGNITVFVDSKWGWDFDMIYSPLHNELSCIQGAKEAL